MMLSAIHKFHHSDDPAVQELQRQIASLAPQNSPTVTWRRTASGMCADASARPVVPVPTCPYVKINGVKVTITGDQARYVHALRNGSGASYQDYDIEPEPDGLAIIDTSYGGEFRVNC